MKKTFTTTKTFSTACVRGRAVDRARPSLLLHTRMDAVSVLAVLAAGKAWQR